MRWLIIFWLLIYIACSGCTSKKKLVDDVKTETKQSTALNLEQNKTSFITEHFGDQLSGVFNLADSLQEDSAVFESGGIILKLRAVKNPKGGKRIDFKAEAKPVARSTLTSENTKLNLKQEHAQKVQTKKTNTVKTKPTGGWLIILLLVVIAGCLVFRLIKF